MSPRARSLTVLTLSLGLIMGTQATADAAVLTKSASGSKIVSDYDEAPTTPQDYRDWICRWVPMACGRS